MNKWNNFWMGVAQHAATLSKDPSTQVGAVIVSKDNRQCSIGYNGFPAGVSEESYKWERPLKYDYAIHAEENAIINSPFDTKGCKLYCTHKPCHRCLGRINNAGIKEVYYFHDYVNPQCQHKKVWLDISKKFDKIEKLCK